MLLSRRRWTQEKIIRCIQKLHEKGWDLSATAMRRSHSALFSSARSPSHFKSWSGAVEAAGIDYERVKRGNCRWSTDAILAEIRRAHKRGEDLLSKEFKLENAELVRAAMAKRHLGSWKRALQSAGIDYEKVREKHYWSRPKIVATIRKLAAEGVSLTWSSIDRVCPGVYRAARRKEMFGSWQAAVAAANPRCTKIKRDDCS